MTLTRRNLLRLATSLAAAPVLPLAAQEWPARPFRILVGTAAGGSPDIISRILGEKLSERLGQSFVIEVNTQGAGAVAQQLVSRSAPDGYTLLMMTGGYPPQMSLRNLGFHPLDGYSFVTTVCGYPMVYAVAPDSPIKSFPDLLEKARAAPGRLTYTITAHGSIYHVLTKWIELESGTTMTRSPTAVRRRRCRISSVAVSMSWSMPRRRCFRGSNRDNCACSRCPRPVVIR